MDLKKSPSTSLNFFLKRVSLLRFQQFTEENSFINNIDVDEKQKDHK